jgi:uncharacterized protein (DUF1810 family)
LTDQVLSDFWRRANWHLNFLSTSSFADAVRELRPGRKVSHWIWYVFPQLAGLGRSPMAVRYGLRGHDEAAAYLRDSILFARLLAATQAVSARLAPVGASALRLDQLMGSDIDAVKLVSSMTLFRAVAARLRAEDARPELGALVAHAEVILTAATAQGYERRAYTEQQLGSWQKKTTTE